MTRPADTWSMADEEFNPIAEIQEILAQVDPDSLCSGFMAIVEWIEPDGNPNLSIVRTPMTPWHIAGLMDYAKTWEASETFPVFMVDQDLEDDDGL